MLITGCNGLLGQRLCQFAAHTCSVYGLGRRKDPPVGDLLRRYVQLDLTQRQSVVDTVTDIGPDWVVNTAAMTDVDRCEREPKGAFAINVGGLMNLMEGCERCGAGLIQISTNYVFDGGASPYGEKDALAPINEYGRTKAEAERLLQESGLGYCIIRTVLLYGSVPGARSNFVQWVCSRVTKGERIRAATDLYGNPTLIDDLSMGILSVMGKASQGIFHMAGSENVSRYEFAVSISDIFELDSSLIEPVTHDAIHFEAPRPLRAELETRKVREALGLRFRSVEEGLRLMREQMDHGRGTERR